MIKFTVIREDNVDRDNPPVFEQVLLRTTDPTVALAYAYRYMGLGLKSLTDLDEANVLDDLCTKLPKGEYSVCFVDYKVQTRPFYFAEPTLEWLKGNPVSVVVPFGASPSEVNELVDKVISDTVWVIPDAQVLQLAKRMASKFQHLPADTAA